MIQTPTDLAGEIVAALRTSLAGGEVIVQDPVTSAWPLLEHDDGFITPPFEEAVIAVSTVEGRSFEIHVSQGGTR